MRKNGVVLKKVEGFQKKNKLSMHLEKGGLKKGAPKKRQKKGLKKGAPEKCRILIPPPPIVLEKRKGPIF